MLSLFFAGCILNGLSPRTAISQQPQVYQVVKQWNGRIYDSQKKEQVVLRSQGELQSFLSHIPKKEIQKKQPAPASIDPLVRGVSIDFSKDMLIVVTRFDNMYAQAEIGQIVEDDTIRVMVSYPPLGDSMMFSSMSGVGTYTLVQVPTSQKEVQFIVASE